MEHAALQILLRALPLSGACVITGPPGAGLEHVGATLWLSRKNTARILDVECAKGRGLVDSERASAADWVDAQLFPDGPDCGGKLIVMLAPGTFKDYPDQLYVRAACRIDLQPTYASFIAAEVRKREGRAVRMPLLIIPTYALHDVSDPAEVALAADALRDGQAISPEVARDMLEAAHARAGMLQAAGVCSKCLHRTRSALHRVFCRYKTTR